MVWAGANYPQEHEEPDMKAADMEPIDPEELAYGETDGAVSINAIAVAKRFNELLFVVQNLEERAGRHHANGWDHMVEDPPAFTSPEQRCSKKVVGGRCLYNARPGTERCRRHPLAAPPTPEEQSRGI